MSSGIRCFAGVGSLLVFCYAASRTNIETEYWKKRLMDMSSVWTFQSIKSTDLKRAQNADLIRYLREWFQSINSKLQDMPALIRPWVGLAFVSVLQPYADASEGKRLCWKICLLNAGVYLAWKIRKWRPAMNVRFMHNPLSGLSYTLLTSMFSHQSFLHLLFNCLALESFGSAAYYYLMREQEKSQPPMLESTGAFHFLAFFISAGLFSGLVSHVASVKFLYPRMVAQLTATGRATSKPDTWAAAVAATTKTASSAAANTAAKEVPRILPSLGASGAVWATLTMTALAFPDSQVALFIPPSYPINIQTAVSGLVLFDMIGILRGWRMFDHWAHLGGAAFGVAYYAYGPDFWHRLRRTFAIDPASIPTS
ncbi:hypothetical protein CC1G_05750 [Coprinopsis cinerea okayama7|uniref:Peptidase S54 rhomboid domain-containing protein n=1 Tax=Coprinopsis cinerea (strain Okayama-7 / 130 / ATCC MYA-4618 / FGSC 9003) TaxID=240176 RepID=A8NA23_COPC7|nr:hypothetical protein CC1G_05750 [Coprinopsis cinerea okayama7\|eukprot:XP_001831679.2 hypothetical protein CC1G_05750 [Coprinopsis cinerea okayama7\